MVRKRKGSPLFYLFIRIPAYRLFGSLTITISLSPPALNNLASKRRGNPLFYLFICISTLWFPSLTVAHSPPALNNSGAKWRKKIPRCGGTTEIISQRDRFSIRFDYSSQRYRPQLKDSKWLWVHQYFIRNVMFTVSRSRDALDFETRMMDMK